MKIVIELNLEFYENEGADYIHDYIDDLTYAMRVDRRLRPDTWNIHYDVTEN